MSDESGKTPLPPDRWDRAKTLSTLFATVFLPLVLAWIANTYSSALKEREIQGKFVELAVSILREEPTKQATGLREWATEVLNKYSGVPFNAETKKALIESTPLPSGFTRYEGRASLGNVETGDGAKFKGRGYLQITGRTLYTRMAQATGAPLVDDPDLAATPAVAGLVLAQWFVENQARYAPALAKDDLAGARRLVSGTLNGSDRIAARYPVYRALLERTPPDASITAIDGVTRPEWIAVDVPAIRAGFAKQHLASVPLQAYALATAEYETVQGRVMVERDVAAPKP